jgi:hypothetical protein
MCKIKLLISCFFSLTILGSCSKNKIGKFVPIVTNDVEAILDTETGKVYVPMTSATGYGPGSIGLANFKIEIEEIDYVNGGKKRRIKPTE